MYYGEGLDNAYYFHPDFDTNGNMLGTGTYETGYASYGFVNHLSTRGTGYNFKLGVIVKPVNELRFGLAFHTPTYYELKDLYKTISSFEMQDASGTFEGEKEAGSPGYWDEYHYNLHTPWRVIASVAGVIGQKGILSLDYEWKGANTMRLCDDRNNEFTDMTADIKDYFQATHTVRIGGEYRVSNNFSLRAGYSYQTSPVKDVVKDGVVSVITTGSNPAYQYDRSVQNITCGFGYRYKAFSLDMAYVHNYRQSNYHAYPAVTYQVGGTDYGNYVGVNDHNNRVSLTLGFRF
jgi:long-subunit fatty acid transport protein